ncbi:MAG TPA: GNAT family N-acetyltransferase [Gaiellaceae bacterium]|jgi:RimJ/RimL family protein N-acetyltransferase|nr:GNAT family N-acetyltransferase [Gaiellaceae bacterium]
MRLTAPDPPLTDGVVTLRAWQDDDAPAIVAAIDGDPEIATWLDAVPQPYRIVDARDYLAQCRRSWADGTGAPFAILDADRNIVGSIGARFGDPLQAVAEVGYWVGRAARGRGCATRALRLLARWLFDEAGIERLQLQADLRNEASLRVAEKAGFTREGVLRSARLNERRGERVDFVMFSLLPGELPD